MRSEFTTGSAPLLEWSYRNKNPAVVFFHLFVESPWPLALALFAVTCKHAPFVFLPVLTAKIIDAIDPTAPEKFLPVLPWIGLYALLVIANLPAHTWFSWLVSRMVRQAETRIRSALVRRMQHLSIAFHDHFQSGRLQSKIIRDVQSISDMGSNVFMNLSTLFLTIAVALIYTAIAYPVMLLFYLGAAPLASGLMWLFGSHMRRANQEFREKIEEMSAGVTEMVDLIPVTRAHGLEGVEIERMTNSFSTLKKKGISLDVVNAMFAASSWVVFTLFQLACLAFSVWLAFRGVITRGDVVSAQGFFGLLVGAISGILGVYPIFTRGFDAIHSIGDVLECPDLERNQGKKAVTGVAGKFEFEQMSFSYPGRATPALDQWQLTVQAGESIALVGESGSGKSTLVSLIIGFRRPDIGRILLDGQDMESLDLRTFRRYISVVPQEVILFSGTVAENVTYGLDGVGEKQVREALEMANAWEFVQEMPDKLGTLLGEKGVKLSGGQRQRIAIARAFIRDPRVLILDEATSALDNASEGLVQKAMERLIVNRTSFIVAHRLSTIRNVDRILVLRNGRISEVGSHAELLARQGEFHRLYSLQR